MPVDRALWKRSFRQFPNWLCPTCQSAPLVVEKDTLLRKEPNWSRDAHGHEAWDPDWIVERFSCLMRCSAPACGEIVVVGGRTSHVEDHDWEQQTQHWAPKYHPKFAYPSLPIFKIPDECPDKIAEQLRKAFSFYWSDAGASANRLRVAVERLLTDRGIVRTTLNKKRKRVSLPLHQRIERYKLKNADAADYLLAIKWLGNIGSHQDVNSIDDTDLLAAFDIFDHVLDLVYVERGLRLKKVAKDLSARKGRAKKRSR